MKSIMIAVALATSLVAAHAAPIGPHAAGRRVELHAPNYDIYCTG